MGWKERGEATTAGNISSCSTRRISRWRIKSLRCAGSERRTRQLSHPNREPFQSATARSATASGRTKPTSISSEIKWQKKSEREYWRLALANGQEDQYLA